MKLKTLNRIARILEKETGRSLPGSTFSVWETLKNFSGSRTKAEAAERLSFCLFNCDFKRDSDLKLRVLELL